jgi:hypothetical protein
MKKNIFMAAAGFTAITAIVFSASCGKALSCVTLVTDINTAAQAYINDPANTAATCVAYREALQAWVDNTKCSGADATAKATYDAVIADLKTECP